VVGVVVEPGVVVGVVDDVDVLDVLDVLAVLDVDGTEQFRMVNCWRRTAMTAGSVAARYAACSEGQAVLSSACAPDPRRLLDPKAVAKNRATPHQRRIDLDVEAAILVSTFLVCRRFHEPR
jgi:hypothetical protein